MSRFAIHHPHEGGMKKKSTEVDFLNLMPSVAGPGIAPGL